MNTVKKISSLDGHGGIIIKKRIVILLLVALSLTGCDSKKNIETAVANTTQASTQATTQPTTQATTQATTKESTQTTQATTKAYEKPTADTYIVPEKVQSSGDNKKIAWSFKRNTDHSKVIGYNQGVDLSKYDAYYIGDTSKKVIYLTFDEGYENGYTPTILDVLKQNDVHAAFFVTKPFMESEPELTKRMVDEGHVVANHTVTHPSMPTLTDEQVKYELEDNANYYKKITGKEMDRFVRPPKGEFSVRTLDISKQLGYKTIFWSLAYLDYDTNNQPGKAAAYKHVMDNYHDGGLFLLHAVSQSNTEALDDMIKSLKEKGYSFASLYDLPKY
jgi:peptidoglycan-N-acetylmuramic acid deacetylase